MLMSFAPLLMHSCISLSEQLVNQFFHCNYSDRKKKMLCCKFTTKRKVDSEIAILKRNGSSAVHHSKPRAISNKDFMHAYSCKKKHLNPFELYGFLQNFVVVY